VVWAAAGFLLLIYCLIALLRRKFKISLTPTLWSVIMLSLLIGGLVFIAPRVYALRANDPLINSALTITNAAGQGIMLCGSLLGCIAQAASEWGEERRERKRAKKAASQSQSE
jgi:hypothetical protein